MAIVPSMSSVPTLAAFAAFPAFAFTIVAIRSTRVEISHTRGYCA